MTDQQQKPDAQTGENGTQTGTDNQQQPNARTEISSLPPDIQKYIEDLRREAADYRKAQKAAEKTANEAKEKQLADEKKWQELAESRAAELAKLKPIAEQHEQITTAFNSSLDNRLKQIPDDIRKKTVDPIRAALSPVDFSNWLDANMEILRARQAPPLDGGAQGSGKSSPSMQLESNEIEMARAMGLTPDAYAKRKAEIQRMKETPNRDWETFLREQNKENKS